METYDDLRSSITAWSFDRTDIATVADDFIRLCEADLNRVLRTRHQLTTTELTPDGDSVVTLPDDYLEFRQVTALTSPRNPLDNAAPDYLDWRFPFRDSGVPKVFAVEGSTLRVLPATEKDIELIYYARLPALGSDRQTNWLLDRMPGLYLYGSLKHAAVYLGNAERMKEFGATFNGLLDAFVADETTAMYARAAPRRSGPSP